MCWLKVNSGRRLVPTALGTTLIKGYQCIDADLCLPDIRSFIEQQITLIAKGKADHVHVVQHVLQQFMNKYSYFVKMVSFLWLASGVHRQWTCWQATAHLSIGISSQLFTPTFEFCFLQIENMDALFEAQFSPLADSGRLLSKCGKCTRYMKYISTQPTRLYCTTCEEVYNLPQNGTIKVNYSQVPSILNMFCS